MQFPFAIAVILLGLDSGTSFLPMDRTNSAATFRNHAVADPLEPSEVIVIEGQRRWYNLMWNDLIGLDGEWEELVDGQRSILRPLSNACSIGIRATWKDEVVYMPMTRKGEVIIDAGWIRIDPLSQRELEEAAGEGNGGPEEAFLKAPGSCAREIDTTVVTEVHPSGDCWTVLPGSGNCQSGWTCGGSGDADGCSVEFVMSSNARIPMESFHSECGGALSYSLCQNQFGKVYFCIRED